MTKSVATKGKARLQAGLSKNQMSEQDNQMITNKTDAQQCAELTQIKLEMHSARFLGIAHLMRGIAGMELEQIKHEAVIATAQNEASIEDGERAAALAAAAIEKAMARAA